MRHIAVPGFATSPCNGLVEEELRPAPSAAPSVAASPAHRSLPIVNAAGQLTNSSEPTGPTVVWICRGCGKLWEREPLPDETL